MNGYLLDTSICVFLFRGKYNISEKLREIGRKNCFVSSVTIAELKYGAYKSDNKERNLRVINSFCQKVNIVPFEETIDEFAKEKNELRQVGMLIEDFDLLIACAAKARNLTLVTDNVRHLGRVNGLEVVNWINR